MLIAARLTTEAGCHVAICEARQHDKFTHPDTQLRSINEESFTICRWTRAHQEVSGEQEAWRLS